MDKLKQLIQNLISKKNEKIILISGGVFIILVIGVLVFSLSNQKPNQTISQTEQLNEQEEVVTEEIETVDLSHLPIEEDVRETLESTISEIKNLDYIKLEYYEGNEDRWNNKFFYLDNTLKKVFGYSSVHELGNYDDNYKFIIDNEITQKKYMVGDPIKEPTQKNLISSLTNINLSKENFESKNLFKAVDEIEELDGKKYRNIKYVSNKCLVSQDGYCTNIEGENFVYIKIGVDHVYLKEEVGTIYGHVGEKWEYEFLPITQDDIPFTEFETKWKKLVSDQNYSKIINAIGKVEDDYIVKDQNGNIQKWNKIKEDTIKRLNSFLYNEYDLEQVDALQVKEITKTVKYTNEDTTYIRLDYQFDYQNDPIQIFYGDMGNYSIGHSYIGIAISNVDGRLVGLDIPMPSTEVNNMNYYISELTFIKESEFDNLISDVKKIN